MSTILNDDGFAGSGSYVNVSDAAAVLASGITADKVAEIEELVEKVAALEEGGTGSGGGNTSTTVTTFNIIDISSYVNSTINGVVAGTDTENTIDDMTVILTSEQVEELYAQLSSASNVVYKIANGTSVGLFYLNYYTVADGVYTYICRGLFQFGDEANMDKAITVEIDESAGTGYVNIKSYSLSTVAIASVVENEDGTSSIYLQ